MEGWIDFPAVTTNLHSTRTLCTVFTDPVTFSSDRASETRKLPCSSAIFNTHGTPCPFKTCGKRHNSLNRKSFSFFFFFNFFGSTSRLHSPPTRNFQSECGEVPPALWRVVRSHSGKCGRLPVKVDEAGRGNNKEAQYSHHNKFIVVFGVGGVGGLVAWSH